MRTLGQTLVHIHTIAERVIATMREEKILCDNFPGYLRVDPIDGWNLLTVQLGTNEHTHTLGEFALANRLSERFDALNEGREGDLVPIGKASSDYADKYGGAVLVQNFQIAYASSSGNCLGDEAVAITIAVRAGLLTIKSLNQHGRLRPKASYFNPDLRRLLAACTWTE